MALTTVEYTYSGQASFAIPFSLGILNRAYVTIQINNQVDGSGDPLYYTNFTWTSDSEVVISGLTNGDIIKIARTIPSNLLLSDYTAGSNITRDNLNIANKQLIMLIHEVLDKNVTQQTKLDTIEVGATADQTAAEIKTAYESNANTNAFTDADESKLDGIEAGADITDTANVTAAGAVMDSEVTDLAGIKAVTVSTLQVKPSEGAFVDGDKTKLNTIETNADVTDTANVVAALTAGTNITIASDGTIASTATGGGGGGVSDIVDDLTPQLGGDLDLNNQDITGTGNISITGTVNTRDMAVDGAKLDAIEALADVTDTDNVVAALTAGTNVTIAADGTISSTDTNTTYNKADIDALNIDADTLDGQHGSYYTSYADTAVAGIVDSAPGTLDTLNELAQALGDDPNFATTTATNLSQKLPKAGGTMTGALTVQADATFTGGGTGSIVINDEDSSLCPTMTFTRNGGGTTTNDFIKFENSGGEVATINSTGGAFLSKVNVNTSGASNTSNAIAIATSGTNFESDGGIISIDHAASGAVTGGYFSKYSAGGTLRHSVKGDGKGYFAGGIDVTGKGTYTGAGSFEALELKTTDANRVYVTGNSTTSGDMWRLGTSTSNANLNIDALQSNGQILLRTGGTTERMRIYDAGIDVSGVIRCVVTSAPAWDTNTRFWGESGFGARYDSYQHRWDVGLTRTEAMRIDQSGNVSIASGNLNVTGSTITTGTSGTTQWQAGSGANKLTIASYDNNIFYHKLSSGNSTQYQVGVEDNIPIHTITNNTVRTALLGNGNFGVGTTNPSAKIEAYGTDASIIVHNSFNSRGGIGALSGGRVGLVTTSINDDLVFGYSGSPISSGSFVERMRIDNGTGNVSIPSGDLNVTGAIEVANSTVYKGIHLRGNVAPNVTFARNTTTTAEWKAGISGILGTSFTISQGTAAASERLVIATGGNVGIGTSSPADKLQVEGNVYLGTSSRSVYTGGGGDLRLQTNTGEVKLLTANGATTNLITSGTGIDIPTSLDVGTTLNVGNATPAGGGTIESHVQSSSTPALITYSGSSLLRTHISFENSNGQVGKINTAGTQTFYVTSSDYRLKTDIQPMQGSIDRIKALKPCNFEWTGDGTRVDGFIAHEAQEVVPEAIVGDKDAMQDQQYVESEATGDIYTPAVDATYETIQVELTPAVDATYDEDGNELTPAVDATYEEQQQELTPAVDEVIHSSDVVEPDTLEEGQLWRQTTEKVMATRQVPDYQGIDQSKLVPLLTSALQEALAKIDDLELRMANLEN